VLAFEQCIVCQVFGGSYVRRFKLKLATYEVCRDRQHDGELFPLVVVGDCQFILIHLITLSKVVASHD